MGDEIKQLIDMVAKLKINMDKGFEMINQKFEEIDKRFEKIDKRFEGIDKRFDNIETAIKELNENQVKILNSIKLIEHDVENNRRHIKRLEERESFL